MNGIVVDPGEYESARLTCVNAALEPVGPPGTVWECVPEREEYPDPMPRRRPLAGNCVKCIQVHFQRVAILVSLAL